MTATEPRTDMIAYAGQLAQGKYNQFINQAWIQNGKNTPELFSPSGKRQIGRAPWFTPDGQYMGYEDHDQNKVMQVWIKKVQKPYDQQTPTPISSGTVPSQHVKFSPDGSTAIWAQGAQGKSQIYAADITY